MTKKRYDFNGHSRNLREGQHLNDDLNNHAQLKIIQACTEVIGDVDPNNTLCGCGPWRPVWLQRCVNVKVFMVFFIAVGIFQGAYFSYIVGSASTLEKRFSYSSKYTGYIMIADTFSSTITSSVAGFIGKRYNKSLLIACGMTFVGLSCLINSFPFFYYGPNSYAQNMHQSSVLSTSDKSQHDLCGSSVGSIIEKCDIDNDIDGMVWPAFLCVWMASFVNGIGYSSFFTLGYPFVDDNVNKANAPLFLAIVSAFRNFGPTIGYMTTTLCLSLREDFLYTSVDVVRLDRTDPRYIGAWWLGFIILAVIIMLLSFPLYLFPKEIKGHKVNREEEEELHMSFFADAKKTTIRVVTNPVIISDSLAGLFHWIGIGGFYLTKPKYIESQYQKSAAEASLTTGLYGTLAMSIGVIMGGAFLKYVRPSPRMLCALILTVEFSMSVAFFISLFLGCPKIHFVGFDEEPPLFGCNDKCDCAGKAFQPVCGSDGVTTYFSPCYAGCKTPFKDINGTLFFRECSCDAIGQVRSGYCESQCDNFTKFIFVTSTASFIASTAWIANWLIQFRALADRDKAVAMGLSMGFFAIFASIPYPLIFGALADASCAFWKTSSCGSHGNCWLYDSDKFRILLIVPSLCFCLLGSSFDVLTIYFSKYIKNMYGEDDHDSKDGGSDKHVNSLTDDERGMQQIPLKDMT